MKQKTLLYILPGVIGLLLIGSALYLKPVSLWTNGMSPMGMHMGGGMFDTSATQKGNLAALTDTAVAKVQPTQVVELKDGDTFNLTASIVQEEVGNKMIKRLAYNGQIPGPILKVQKGAKVTVHFTNNIDMNTTVHSHGLRGDYHFDGTPGMSQDPVKVGDSFDYQLTFPDTGVFWYHPHIREDYQQELGLYGNFIVTEEGYWNPVDREEYMIVDDFLKDGTFSGSSVSHTLMGRYGDEILINDKSEYTLTVKQGEITRFFITNVANARPFDLHFDGALIKQVGGDVGRIEKEMQAAEIHLGPAERSIIEVLYQDPGEYALKQHGVQVGTITVEPSDESHLKAFAQLRNNDSDYAVIRSQMNQYLAKEPDKKIRLTLEPMGNMMRMMQNSTTSQNSNGMVTLMGMQMTVQGAIDHCKSMPDMAGCEPYNAIATMGSMNHSHSADGIEWEDNMRMMNGQSTQETIKWVLEDQVTGKKNEEINWTFKKGEMVKMQIFNDPKSMHPMQHPIHFHGQRFVVLSDNGVPNANMQWKDTTLVAAGHTVDILVDMSNPGLWMGHCHIAEHLEAGMMFNFKVE